MHVILDVSRLLSCARRDTPSGIDRVELAYARRWSGEHAAPCCFVTQDSWGQHTAIPTQMVRNLIDALDAAWSLGNAGARAFRRARKVANKIHTRTMLGLGRGALKRALANRGPKAFLLVSHRALERAGPIEAMRRQGCAFVPLIHDLIPATHPEYARPGEPAKHLRRIGVATALADGIIVNSAATAGVLAPHLARRGDPPPVCIAHLGIEPPDLPDSPVQLEPYFVVLGTIEPRKNHLLLLQLWREFAAELGAKAPRLLIVGRRGWENENVLDMLERCEALRGLVEEVGQLPDRDVATLLRGARALVFPSFAEGYGLPLAEALALGVPAICSDLPALREVGGDVPDYLDPLDGAAWRGAIHDYASLHAPRRMAQLARLASWRVPSWNEHFSAVDSLLARAAAACPPGRPAWSPPALGRPAEAWPEPAPAFAAQDNMR